MQSVDIASWSLLANLVTLYAATEFISKYKIPPYVTLCHEFIMFSYCSLTFASKSPLWFSSLKLDGLYNKTCHSQNCMPIVVLEMTETNEFAIWTFPYHSHLFCFAQCIWLCTPIHVMIHKTCLCSMKKRCDPSLTSEKIEGLIKWGCNSPLLKGQITAMTFWFFCLPEL